MRITELTEQEKLYASKQSQQIRGQTGAVECSFVVFDNNCLYQVRNTAPTMTERRLPIITTTLSVSFRRTAL